MNPKEEEKGPLIGSIIVILVLVLGAVYILANKKTVEQPVAETASGNSRRHGNRPI